jgi:integrase
MLRWSARMGLVVRNVADSVEPPRSERKEMQVLDPDGVARLLRAAQGTELQAIIAVAIGTGLRRGELLALRWSDADLDAQRLNVPRSLDTHKGVTRTKPPKTARSARTIALPPFVIDVLRNERVPQRELRHASVDGWIFRRADGASWEPGAFSLAFARFVKGAKLPHVRFHDLRHSFGTLALASGVDLQTLSRALGHESTAITWRIYLHAIEALQEDAAARIDGLLGAVVTKALGNAPGSLTLRQARGDTEARHGTEVLPHVDKSVPQRCQTPLPTMKNARRIERFRIAPTGIESAGDDPD